MSTTGRAGRGSSKSEFRGIDGLDEMTDEQVLDAWHAAKMAQKFATTEDLTIRMALKLKAEAAAIRRFGVGGNLEAYKRRFPEDNS